MLKKFVRNVGIVIICLLVVSALIGSIWSCFDESVLFGHPWLRWVYFSIWVIPAWGVAFDVAPGYALFSLIVGVLFIIAQLFLL